MSITPEQIDILRAPFTPQAVKFRLDAKAPRNGKVRCVVYIDASLAADRLTLVDPAYSSRYRTLGSASEHSPVECTITVLGVERADAGQYAQAKSDDKHMKSAYSDAFKRAAAAHHVGAYLRTMPPFFVTEQGCWKAGEKLGGINDAGLAQLRQQYARFISDSHLVARFGAAIDHGDIVSAAPPIETEGLADAADAPLLNEEQRACLEEISAACGHAGKDRSDLLAEDYAVLVKTALKYAVKQKVVTATDAEDVEAAALALDADKVRAELGGVLA